MSDRKTDNGTLVKALRILSVDIQSEDGVANACIAEAADRIEMLDHKILLMRPDVSNVDRKDLIMLKR